MNTERRQISAGASLLNPVAMFRLLNSVGWFCFVGCQAFGLPAFPGAEGAGANAVGGRGGTVFYVTTTNDNGSSTLAGSLGQGVSIAVPVGPDYTVGVSTNFNRLANFADDQLAAAAIHYH